MFTVVIQHKKLIYLVWFKLVKNADIDKCKYSGYSIGFHMKRTFGFPAIGFRRNIIIFGSDIDSSVHIDN